MVCCVQLSPGFDKCFVVHSKKKQNQKNMTHLATYWICTFKHCDWLAYQNESRKINVLAGYYTEKVDIDDI